MAQPLSPPSPFPPRNSEERSALLAWIGGVSLVYGGWTHFKRIFKAAESAFALDGSEPEIMAAFLARLDAQPFGGPVKIGAPLLPNRYCDIAVHPTAPIAYALIQQGKLEIYDITSPVEPRLIKTLSPRNNAWNSSLQVTEKYLLLSLQNNAQIFDLSDPANPQQLGDMRLNFNARALVGDVLVTNQNGFSVQSLPTSTQPNPTTIGSLSDYNINFVRAGQGFVAAQVTSGKQRLQVFDVSNPSAPRAAGHIDVSLQNMVLSGRTAIGIYGENITAFDLSDLERPRRAGQIRLQGARNIWVKGNILVVYCYEYNYRTGVITKLSFIDISQPHDLRLVGELNTDWCTTVAMLGDILWVSGNQGTRAYSFNDPARAQEVGRRPSDKTFGYLKRRGRRLLRTLAHADENRYFNLALPLLKATQGQEAIDFRSQWVCADILVNSHPGWEQKHHGRGRVARTKGFVRRALPVRAASAWRQYPLALRELTEESYPWQVAFLARRSLAQAGQPTTPFTPKQLEAILWGDWPFAIREVAREALPRLGEISPRAAAALLWSSNRKTRRDILSGVETSPAMASGLATLLGQNTPAAGGLTRRGRDIALLLAARFDLSAKNFDSSGALPAIAALLGANEAPLRELGLNFCRRIKPESVLDAVTMLPQVPQAARTSFIDALCESAQKGDYPIEVAFKRVRHPDNAVRAAVWQILAASKTKKTTLRDLWTGVLGGLKRGYVRDATRGWGYQWEISSILQVALDSEAALQILGRVGVNPYSITRFGAMFWLEPSAPASVFAAYSLFISADEVTLAIAEAPDAVWASWKTAWLRANRLHPTRLAGFWSQVRASLEDKRLSDAAKARLRARTFGDAQIAATFAAAVGELPPTLLIQLIAAVPDEVWAAWRGGLVQTLQNDAPRRVAFWQAVREIGFSSELLQQRLVQDEEIARTFGLLPDVLEFDDPALETLLLTWLNARESELDTSTLVTGAIHPLTAVRLWALQRLQARGLSISLSLRLMESKLREPVETAQAWFNAQTSNLTGLALALCDSPSSEVRAWGRDYVAGHLEGLLQDGFVEALAENPNPEMQSFVAELLLKQPAKNTAEFDRAVLRGRNRARRAKSLVQTRRTQNEALEDEAVLLELARGKTPRDADWAWTQLAQAASEGRDSKTVKVSGVGAI